jgi:hypothetical protein
MAYSVNWVTKVVTVPKADMTQVSASVYTLDVLDFWSKIHLIQSGEEGQPHLDIMRSNVPVTLGGVSYARSVEVINGYRIEFENGPYQIDLVGANNNLLDARVQNNVSLNAANSAGLVVVNSGGGGPSLTAAQVWQHVIEGSLSAEQFQRIIMSVLAGKVAGAGTGTETFRDIADTKARVVSTVDAQGNRTAVALDGA